MLNTPSAPTAAHVVETVLNTLSDGLPLAELIETVTKMYPAILAHEVISATLRPEITTGTDGRMHWERRES